MRGLVISSVLLLGACLGACTPDLIEGNSSEPLDSVHSLHSVTEQPGSPTDAAVAELATEPSAQVQVEPELPPPEPAPFAGRETVRVDELLAALSEELEPIAASSTVRDDYEAFLVAFELEHDDELYLDYVRVKLAFEATRAGGWWGLAWDITNEQPNSDKIWAHWQTLDQAHEWGAVPATVDELSPLPEVTAIAECDELSALFAFVAQRIGLSRRSEVGLFWPTGNHTVAVWTIDAKGESPTRVVVPTSQIFLDDAQTLGTREFNPWRQRRIFDYRRQDAAVELELPGPLASHFVLAVRERGTASQSELQAQRNDKEGRQQWDMAPEPGDG